MNKIAIYIFFVLIFLAVMREFIPDFKAKSYITDESSYSYIFKGAPVSVILLDAYQIGFILKSNIHTYRIFRVFGHSETISLSVSSEFFQKTLGYIGLSVFHRNENSHENTTPIPPGSLFIGKIFYGSWRYKRAKERVVWVFHNHYKHFNREFFWGEFLPDKVFYQTLKKYLDEDKVFTGLSNEFGSEGFLTQSQLSGNWHKNQNRRYSLRDYLAILARVPMRRSR